MLCSFPSPVRAMNAYEQLLIPAATLFFLVWAVVGVAVGAGLILCSARMFRLFGVMNRYVSTRTSLKPLAMPRDIAAGVGRHRRVVGVFFVLAAVYALYGLFAWFDDRAVVAALNLRFPGPFVAWILDAARWFLVLCSALALVVGIMLVAFPEALRRLEARANRWYSVRQMATGVDTMHFSLDRLVEAFPRPVGAVVLVASLYVAVNAAALWVRIA